MRQNAEDPRVFNPSLAEDGFVSEHTVVQPSTTTCRSLSTPGDDGDQQTGRTAHWIVHPLMSVARNADGTVENASTVAAATAAGRNDSSRIADLGRMRSHREHPDQQALIEDLQRPLAGCTKAAVED